MKGGLPGRSAISPSLRAMTPASWSGGISPSAVPMAAKSCVPCDPNSGTVIVRSSRLGMDCASRARVARAASMIVRRLRMVSEPLWSTTSSAMSGRVRHCWRTRLGPLSQPANSRSISSRHQRPGVRARKAGISASRPSSASAPSAQSGRVGANCTPVTVETAAAEMPFIARAVPGSPAHGPGRPYRSRSAHT